MTVASPRRPSASGRNPCGSRTAIIRSLVSSARENAPCICETDSTIASIGFGRLRPRIKVKNHFRIAVRLENRSLAHELGPKLAGIDEIAVVTDRDLAVRAIDQNRLGIRELALARGRIPDVADRHRTGQLRQRLAVEGIGDVAHGLRDAHLAGRPRRRCRRSPVRDAAARTARGRSCWPLRDGRRCRKRRTRL